MKIDFNKQDGLVPAVVQDAETNKVLMLAYMNEDAYNKTIDTKMVTFWSRSRNELWTKGETSGNTMKLVDIAVDCDNDTLLVKVIPVGPVCHLGSDTCWDETNSRFTKHVTQSGTEIVDDNSANEGKEIGEFISHLEDVIKERRTNMSDKSYVASLFKKGINKIAQKVGEEGVEVVIEAMDNNDDLFLNENADLLFHQLILLQAKGYTMKDVIEVLKGREK
ncbi:MAG: bifunctional phosphoribosyl-AMP cyclohydrolase/phosphoribosyl-ATP diphosphatase HisIE [Ichthyobacteriaceae bacterium]|nr:bifunctional phosphoribosyl-AMP cyclohydrolase/phosphoribosyl-ATP diphosphatase HisIE [Ichthyobacteriaceae bacterium]